MRRVELTHDVLCGVVRASRDLRLEREARDEAERKLAAQRERELRHAQGAGARAADRGGLRGARRRRRRQRRLRLRQHEARAAGRGEGGADARCWPKQARGEAEKLIVYLLDDFYLELEPVGRLDIVGELAKRALDYYSALPPELRTPRPSAIARWRWCAMAPSLRTQSQARRKRQGAREAVDVLGKLRAAGRPRPKPPPSDWALGLVAQARVADSLNQDAPTRGESRAGAWTS